jgi:hypothetical protein
MARILTNRRTKNRFPVRTQRSNPQRLAEGWSINGIRDFSFDWETGKAKIDVDDLDALLSSERQALNGVGLFYANSNEELIATSGRSKVGAVSSHFGWLSEVPEVYGTSSIQRILERRY